MLASKEALRILYVCPWAHRAGHYPEATITETSALSKAGTEVHICTFEGILDQGQPIILPQRKVRSSWLGFPVGILTHSIDFLPKVRTIAQLLEAIVTLFSAVKLRRSLRYDVIYLRDGDPFIFLPLLLGLVVKHYRWAIVLTGHLGEKASFNLFPYKFSIAPFWKPIYRRSLSRNQYTFICQNRHMQDFFNEKFLGGVLSGGIRLIPRAVRKTRNYLTQEEARQHLSLPKDKVICLHFGALHIGKDIETVLVAIRDIPDVLLIHVGKIMPGVNLTGLVRRYGLQDRVIIRDYYIQEPEIQHHFFSADAIILSYRKHFMQTASTLLKAAEFKLPVIASDSGELGELVERYQIGWCFKAEDANSLKDMLFLFLNSSQSQKETMKSNWDKFCDDFSLDDWAKKSIEVLKGELGLINKGS
jgi:glycosyltransferase involved in cell wall biosynthesis